MPFNFLVQLIIGLALAFISFLLMPRPKVAKPNEVQDLQSPTAESGRPIPVVFGTVLIESPNVLWYGEKRTEKKGL
jgi:hypothetical protein